MIRNVRTAPILIPVLALALASAAVAQIPNISGPWKLHASGRLPAANADCVFEGSGEMIQDGSMLSGHATLMLVQGPAECPAEMMADLMGSLDGLSFFGSLNGGKLFGILSFSGRVGADGRSIAGSFSVPDGEPFQGTTGDWLAARLSVLAVPTLGAVGLGLLALLLLLTSVLILRRRTA